MKRLLVRLSSCVLLTGVAAAPLRAGGAGPSAANPDLGGCFTAQSAVTPFAGVVLAAGGNDRFLRVAGTVDGHAAPTADTPYRLASASKLFTQVAIGQLIDQHRLDPNAPIGSYLPDLPPTVAAITIDQLLHHRSGITAGHMMTPGIATMMQRARTARDLLPMVVEAPLAFPPGTKTEYSNGGYYVLGAIVEAVSGLDYADYLAQKIFRPLGMRASSLAAGPDAAPSLTLMAGPGAPPRATPAPMAAMLTMPGNPAGDAVSTANDMARFGRALLGAGLLSEATRRIVFNPLPGGRWRAGQAGGRPGGNVYFIVYPEQGRILVVLTNYDPPAGELMGETLGTLLTDGTCHPLSATDRPSPMRIVTRPPPAG